MSYKGYLDEQLPSNIGAADSLEYGTGIDRVNAQRLTRSTGDVTREDSLITDKKLRIEIDLSASTLILFLNELILHLTSTLNDFLNISYLLRKL